MFQGIITHLGEVRRREKKGRFMRLGIASDIFAGKAEGSSIAINGACLTIINPSRSCGQASRKQGLEILKSVRP